MKTFKMSIGTNGKVAMIYDDAHAPFMELGHATVTRASNVEPAAGGWQATMRDGTVIGPYRLRADALAAEVKYLEAKLF